MRDINKIVVHCAATKPSMDIGAEEIKGWHVDDNGWSDIGYHFVIRRSGEVEEGRDIRTPGAHAKGHNHDSLGVCLVGGMSEDGYDESNFTALQYNALAALILQFIGEYPDCKILGHCDLEGVAKTCPNFNVRSFIGAD